MQFTLNTNSLHALSGKPRRSKFGISSLILTFMVGLIFTAISVTMFTSAQIQTGWKKTNGVVKSISISNGSNNTILYTPVVSYRVDGTEYLVTGQATSSNVAAGSTRTVAYDPSTPAQSKTVTSKGSMVLLGVVMAIGIGTMIGAVVFFVKSRQREKTITDVMKTGTKVRGIVTDIEDQSYSAASNVGAPSSAPNSYRVQVQATAPNGTVGTYVSDRVTGLGGIAMMDFRSNPIPIDVYINPNNPEEYYVDVSELPSLTPQRISELVGNAIGNIAGPSSFTAQPQVANPSIQTQAQVQPQSVGPVNNVQPQPQVVSPTFAQPQVANPTYVSPTVYNGEAAAQNVQPEDSNRVQP